MNRLSQPPLLPPKEPQQSIPRRPLLQVQITGQRRQTRVSRNRHNLPQGHLRTIEMGSQRLLKGVGTAPSVIPTLSSVIRSVSLDDVPAPSIKTR